MKRLFPAFCIVSLLLSCSNNTMEADNSLMNEPGVYPYEVSNVRITAWEVPTVTVAWDNPTDPDFSHVSCNWRPIPDYPKPGDNSTMFFYSGVMGVMPLGKPITFYCVDKQGNPSKGVEFTVTDEAILEFLNSLQNN